MTDENDKTNEGAPQAPTGTPSQTGPRAPLSLKPRQAGSVSTGSASTSRIRPAAAMPDCRAVTFWLSEVIGSIRAKA